MKHSKKLFIILMAVGLCAVFAACGPTAGKTEGNSTQAESAAEDSVDENLSEAESQTEESEGKDLTSDLTPDQTDDTVKTVNIGFISWFLGRADEYEFIEDVKTILSEQYSDQIGDVYVADAMQDDAIALNNLSNLYAMWEGEKIVVLIVNEDNGFNDEELLSILKNAEEVGIIAGVDHAIDGAPESTFVYDASDAAGCAAMIMENSRK